MPRGARPWYSARRTMGYEHRRQVHLENDRLRVTLLPGGGHIAAVVLKENGVNPLWDPPWDTIEPSAYDSAAHPQYGDGVDAKLLAGIVGHNLCFDLFGLPSGPEAAAGLGVHGEAPASDWDMESGDSWLAAEAALPLAGMHFKRRLELAPGSCRVDVVETVINRTGVDRPVGWTQHVTLGPPFLEKGRTRFRASATLSKVFETEFAPGADRFAPARKFDWPRVPLADGGTGDLRQAVDCEVSGGYTAHLMDPWREEAYFSAYNPASETLCAYVWKRKDFPWLGIWEENRSRAHAPWNGRTFARGMEFGVSPFPETRREAVERGTLFGERTMRWIPARSAVTINYFLFLCRATPEESGRFGSERGWESMRRFASR